MNNVWCKLSRNFSKFILGSSLALATNVMANENCDETTMDAFAYEDCINEQKGAIISNENFGDKAPAPVMPKVEIPKYQPFGQDAYLTSSFGENRGTRYHAGLDYSTDMEEGWPIYAPENGIVKELRVSPFGYGKVMFFQGNSGKTWVFAHQSSFGKLDELVSKQQYATKKNDVTVKPNKAFKKGDTLSFAGSSGIGNPHLHLEVRLDQDRVINPVLQHVAVSDSMAPQILAAAVWQDNEMAITSREAINAGCAVTPVKNEFNLNMAVKIADYSRLPKENPMSVRRLTLWRYDEKILNESLDTLRFSRMAEIRNQLLWAEEADSAGDWHVLNAKLAPLSTYTLEIEDFAGNVTSQKFSFHSKCKNNDPIPMTKVQTAPVFTFLSRPMLDMFRCESGTKYTVMKKDEVLAENLCSVYKQRTPLLIGKIMETYPEMTDIRYTADASSTGDGKALDETIAVVGYKRHQTNVSWNVNYGDVKISQKVTGMPVAKDSAIRVLALTKTHTDSLDFFEFHPKGLQLKNWNVCIENRENPAPLYWLGETSRNWFIFSKQTKGKNRCASTNELRDIASIDNQQPITLGFPYWDATMIGGVRQSALKIPLMYKYDGVADGNAITVKYKNKWIAAEYDSEPREVIIEGEMLPDAGEAIQLQLVDEANHKVVYDIVLPEM